MSHKINDVFEENKKEFEEENDPALNGLRDAKDLSEGEYVPDMYSEAVEDEKAKRSGEEQVKNNYFK